MLCYLPPHSDRVIAVRIELLQSRKKKRWTQVVFARLNRLLDKELNEERNNTEKIRDVTLVYVMKVYKGSRGTGPSFLTSALGGDEMLASRPGRFTPDTR